MSLRASRVDPRKVKVASREILRKLFNMLLSSRDDQNEDKCVSITYYLCTYIFANKYSHQLSGRFLKRVHSKLFQVESTNNI